MAGETDGGGAPIRRRGFLKLVTVALGALAGVILGIPAIRFLVFPIESQDRRRAGRPRAGRQRRRCERQAPPRRDHDAQQRDAWAKVENVPPRRRLARARRRARSARSRRPARTSAARSTTTPRPARSAARATPASFDKAGNRVSGPAKRGMDPLDDQLDGRPRPGSLQTLQAGRPRARGRVMRLSATGSTSAPATARSSPRPSTSRCRAARRWAYVFGSVLTFILVTAARHRRPPRVLLQPVGARRRGPRSPTCRIR